MSREQFIITVALPGFQQLSAGNLMLASATARQWADGTPIDHFVKEMREAWMRTHTKMNNEPVPPTMELLIRDVYKLCDEHYPQWWAGQLKQHERNNNIVRNGDGAGGRVRKRK